MKTIFVTINLILSVISYAQINSSIESKIDSLKKANYEYSTLIEKNNQMILKLNDLLFLQKNSKNSNVSINILSIEDIFVRNAPSLLSKISHTIPKGKTVEIISFENDFFTIRFDGGLGFIHPSNTPMNEKLFKLMEISLEKNLENAKNDYERGQIINQLTKLGKDKSEWISENNRQETIPKKYSSLIAQKILAGKIWIGMTFEMALDSWGEPEDINRTVTNSTIHEQWVYKENKYLYFENGKLSAWQD
ncbi:MAG: SH3 domain-containing protein [Prolixibacteraceae bacterium]|nr:SH3 domain-containing protein [Prolixibacteraceae bacterium]